MILSCCQNHGSVYSRNGESKANGANDSAGILGNITAYEATKAGDGQKYTINVVDCVNAPSENLCRLNGFPGIVGFFSTDNVLSKSYNDARYSIGISTENIVLNIDRCRNYAEKLVGDPYSAGIMGDRYERNGKSGSSKLPQAIPTYKIVFPSARIQTMIGRLLLLGMILA